MTGWWQAPDQWAYSVRPDLWGPGHVVEAWDGDQGPYTMLAEWHWSDHVRVLTALCAGAEGRGYDWPGAVESLVLAGHVQVALSPFAPGGKEPRVWTSRRGLS